MDGWQERPTPRGSCSCCIERAFRLVASPARFRTERRWLCVTRWFPDPLGGQRGECSSAFFAAVACSGDFSGSSDKHCHRFPLNLGRSLSSIGSVVLDSRTTGAHTPVTQRRPFSIVGYLPGQDPAMVTCRRSEQGCVLCDLDHMKTGTEPTSAYARYRGHGLVRPAP